MSPRYQPRYSPRFRVTVGGRCFQEPGGRIADLVVETTLSGADRFSFTLHYPFDEELGTFDGLSWSAFAVDTAVSIAMGYGGDGTLTPLLSGEIEAVEGAFSPETGPTVTVSGSGLLGRLMRGTRSDSWTETRLDRVVEDVCSSYGFDRIDAVADLTRPKLIQDNQSDYRFLCELAETYGFEFYADRDTVRFRPRGERGEDDPVTELWYGEALREFEGEIHSTQSARAVEVRTWDGAAAEEIVERAGPSDAPSTDVHRAPAASRTEARRIATERHAAFADGMIEGRGEADGTPAIRAGSTITLGELGERFSGRYAVTEATHRMGEAGYQTTFEATEVPS